MGSEWFCGTHSMVTSTQNSNSYSNTDDGRCVRAVWRWAVEERHELLVTQTDAKNGFRAEQLVVMIESISRRQRFHEKSRAADQEATGRLVAKRGGEKHWSPQREHCSAMICSWKPYGTHRGYSDRLELLTGTHRRCGRTFLWPTPVARFLDSSREQCHWNVVYWLEGKFANSRKSAEDTAKKL